MHIADQVYTCLLQTSMHNWHLHHRHQQQHNLASQHAHMRLACTALRIWWCAWQHPADGGGFDFELPTKPTAPPTPTAPDEQPTLRHGKWGAAAQDITLTTLTCHIPTHHRPHSPCTPVTHTSQHEDALLVCKTATRSAAKSTSPLTPTPPTLHNDALLARAKAEHAIADHCILQRIIDRYAHAKGAQAGITVEARRRADQQDTVARELE